MLDILTSNYASKLLELTSQSRSSIDFLSYVVNFNLYKRSDRANLIYQALKDFSFLNGHVRCILDFPKLHKSNYNCNKFSTRRFKDAGFDVRFLGSGDTQHTKLFIFDGRFSVVGSHNFTSRSVVNRYDISLFSDDVHLVELFTSFFNNLWEISVEA